jgi:hypothetical protein
VPEPLVLTSPPETKKNRRTLHPVPNFVDPLVTRWKETICGKPLQTWTPNLQRKALQNLEVTTIASPSHNRNSTGQPFYVSTKLVHQTRFTWFHHACATGCATGVNWTDATGR